MRTLVYKRTHNGDPDENGCFGVNDCMGRVRDYDYKAVIGIGGVGREVPSKIRGKVNWIGIDPIWGSSRGRRASLVTFKHFKWFGDRGPKLRKKARYLAARMYAKNGPRYVLKDFDPDELSEIDRLLDLARKAQPSRAGSTRRRSSGRKSGGCRLVC